MISAPSSIICLACLKATSGSMNWPPSEKESGVMLRTPIMMGRFLASSRPRILGMRTPGAPIGSPIGPSSPGGSVAPVIVMAGRFARGEPHCQALDQSSGGGSVGNLELQPFGLIDPALDGAVGGEHASKLALGIGVRHGAGELGRVAVFQFLDRIDTGRLQQPGVIRSNPLDPHPV